MTRRSRNGGMGAGGGRAGHAGGDDGDDRVVTPARRRGKAGPTVVVGRYVGMDHAGVYFKATRWVLARRASYLDDLRLAGKCDLPGCGWGGGWDIGISQG